jgi:hypothetical protein
MELSEQVTCTCVTQAMCDAQFNFLFGVAHGSDAKRGKGKATLTKATKNLCDDNKNHIFIRISKTPEIHLYPNK